VKKIYRDFCTTEKSIPIFSQPWWLDSVAGADNWDVVLIEKKGRILATMPFVIKNYFSLRILTMPPLTQTLGPWLCKSKAKYSKTLTQHKKFMTKLFEKLPPFDHFMQNFHYSQTNWLPIYWLGFKQTTRYTYILQDLQNEEKIWDEFQENIRTDIRKAGNRLQINIRNDKTVSDFYKLNRMVFERQGKTPPYTENFLRRLDKACVQHNARRIFIAEDGQGRHHAGVYLIWDRNSAYYLMGGSDPKLRNSGANSLCIWEAIKFASTVTKQFDFEGSMIEPIERFFRAFGATQTPYFSISKTPSKLLRAGHCLNQFWKSR
jgi:lipid II:glycine glycyltransferase (peptidoglycan interpeptide bridge formation enzyme)